MNSMICDIAIIVRRNTIVLPTYALAIVLQLLATEAPLLASTTQRSTVLVHVTRRHAVPHMALNDTETHYLLYCDSRLKYIASPVPSASDRPTAQTHEKRQSASTQKQIEW